MRTPSTMPGWFRGAIALLILTCAALGARAHPAVSTVAAVKITPDGQVIIRVTHDGLAYALNDTSVRISDAEMYALLNGPEAALDAQLKDGVDRFNSGFKCTVDGTPVTFTITEAPSLAAVHQWERENPARRLPCKLVFEAHALIPSGKHLITFKYPTVLGDILFAADRPGQEPVYLPIPPGDPTPPMEVRIGAAAQAVSEAGNESTRPLGFFATAGRYIALGFTHILPWGYDHALFVTGLFLLTPRPKTLLWQISAFTLAHSLTLTLATLGIARIPSIIVEPTIAFTIAFVALENLAVTKPKPWRAGLAFLFGLVHGLGFASALADVGLPPGQLATALIAFNVGVECGHITVLAALFALLGWTRDKPWYRKRVAMPISIGIAALATFWAVGRIVAPG